MGIGYPVIALISSALVVLLDFKGGFDHHPKMRFVLLLSAILLFAYFIYFALTPVFFEMLGKKGAA